MIALDDWPPEPRSHRTLHDARDVRGASMTSRRVGALGWSKNTDKASNRDHAPGSRSFSHGRVRPAVRALEGHHADLHRAASSTKPPSRSRQPRRMN